MESRRGQREGNRGARASSPSSTPRRSATSSSPTTWGRPGFSYSGSTRSDSAPGNLEIVRNSGEFLLESTYSGNLIFSDNVGPSELTFNYAVKHIFCFGNDPAPTGYYNEAGKSVEGQCAALGPEAYPED